MITGKIIYGNVLLILTFFFGASQSPRKMSLQVTGVDTVRIATFNIATASSDSLKVLRDLKSGSQRLKNIAEIIQTVRPDILFVQELEYDCSNLRIRLFKDNYLGKSQGGKPAIDYPYYFHFPTNAGVQTGYDLNKDGQTGGPYDAHGWGLFPGQFAVAVFSKFPIAYDRIRTFRNLKWKDLPNNHRPVSPESGDYFWDDELWPGILLSSKNHIDVPVNIDGHILHLLGYHAQSGLGDGPELRNSLKNFDEAKFFSDYLNGYPFRDDKGNEVSFALQDQFVIAGDFNSNPYWSGSLTNLSALQLLNNPLVNQDVAWGKHVPVSAYGKRKEQENKWLDKRKKYGTRIRPSGLIERIDYVLPSANLEVVNSGIFWPPLGAKGHGLVAEIEAGSDHRLVYVDILIRGTLK